MKGHNPIEVAKTVLEVADVAWSAVEHCHHHTHNHSETTPYDVSEQDDELKSLRSENERLKRLLQQNLVLLQSMSQSPLLLQDCPPDVCFLLFLFPFLPIAKKIDFSNIFFKYVV